MRTRPHPSKRAFPTTLTVLATAAADTVGSTVNATAAHAAACRGYVGLTFDEGHFAATSRENT